MMVAITFPSPLPEPCRERLDAAQGFGSEMPGRWPDGTAWIYAGAIWERLGGTMSGPLTARLDITSDGYCWPMTAEGLFQQAKAWGAMH